NACLHPLVTPNTTHLRSETNRVAATLGDSKVLEAGVADVSRVRERTRRRRLIRATTIFVGIDAFLIYRVMTKNPLGLPHLGPDRSEEHTSELQSRGHLVC